jgi:NitT/TauT family transport system substrate-binding protein
MASIFNQPAPTPCAHSECQRLGASRRASCPRRSSLGILSTGLLLRYARKSPLIHVVTWTGWLLFWAAGGLASDTAALPKVTLLPQWIPQAQFAGYYVALEKGFYRQNEVELAIIPGGPRKKLEDALASGEASFVTHFLSSALKLRDEGVPLVNLAQISQRSALMLVARRSSGIYRVEDLAGKKISLWPDFAVQPLALFKKYNLDVRTITQGATINLFMRGGADAASAMWYNEYHLMLNAGINAQELTLIFFDQYGLNFPEDGIYCLAETWRQQPEVCRRFVKASLAGWEYAFNHMDEALEIVMRRADEARTGTNRSHQRWMLQRMRDVITPEATARLGVLRREDYQTVTRELKTSGFIRSIPDFETFYVGAVE